MINIGTGIDPRKMKRGAGSEPRRRQTPPAQKKRPRKGLTGPMNMIRNMKAHTTETEQPFYLLKMLAGSNKGMLDVHRFSAHTGLHKIKLDKYKRLEEIRELTNEYIRDPSVDSELREVAQKLADGWKYQQEESLESSGADDSRVHIAPPRSSDTTPIQKHPSLTGSLGEGSSLLRHAAALPPLAINPHHLAPPDDSTSPEVPPSPQLTQQLLPDPDTPARMSDGASQVDTLSENVISPAPASDRAAPSQTTSLSIHERAHDPLPQTPARPAHPTRSLNGTTPQGSLNISSSAPDTGPPMDISAKEISIGVGEQFSMGETSS